MNANRATEDAADAAARPAALAAAAQTLFSGLGLVAGIAFGVIAAKNGDISGPAAAVVALTPLAAFEAVGAIPAAITQFHRSSAAAARLAQMSDEPEASVASGSTEAAILTLTELSVGWPGATPTPSGDRERFSWYRARLGGEIRRGQDDLAAHGYRRARPGRRFGHLRRHFASRRRTRAPPTPSRLRTPISLGPRCLRICALLAAASPRIDAWEVLQRVGLDGWARSLPSGLDTELGTGGHTVSGGERRRLLMARALLADVPLQLLDEPGEHLDAAGIAAFGAAIDAHAGPGPHGGYRDARRRRDGHCRRRGQSRRAVGRSVPPESKSGRPRRAAHLVRVDYLATP